MGVLTVPLYSVEAEMLEAIRGYYGHANGPETVRFLIRQEARRLVRGGSGAMLARDHRAVIDGYLLGHVTAEEAMQALVAEYAPAGA